MLASLSTDDDALEPDNRLRVFRMVSHRRLQKVASKRNLLRSCKHRKCEGECPHGKGFNDEGYFPDLATQSFLTYRVPRKSVTF